jgi:ABC-type transport system involved in cytochrome bd biosynthesis fused ATPase/permease subunit
VDSETVDNLLNKIAAVLEEHTVILVSHRQNFEHIFEEVAQVKTRLEKLEVSDSDKYANADFIAEMTARLKAISDSLRAKD